MFRMEWYDTCGETESFSLGMKSHDTIYYK